METKRDKLRLLVGNNDIQLVLDSYDNIVQQYAISVGLMETALEDRFVKIDEI